MTIALKTVGQIALNTLRMEGLCLLYTSDAADE